MDKTKKTSKQFYYNKVRTIVTKYIIIENGQGCYPVMLPQAKDVNGCRSSTNDKLFFDTAASTFWLHNTATIGENDD